MVTASGIAEGDCSSQFSPASAHRLDGSFASFQSRREEVILVMVILGGVDKDLARTFADDDERCPVGGMSLFAALVDHGTAQRLGTADGRILGDLGNRPISAPLQSFWG
jgi:hypothetical protein